MDGFLMLLRWLHFLFGITWIGLLYYFNLVQVPFFAETEAPVRVGAQAKLLPRAMWWFRWGAMGTVIFGVLYLLIYWGQTGWSFNSWAVAILTGGALGIVMWYNVWFVIWPNQQIVIANAVATSAGGQANPAAAPAGRHAGHDQEDAGFDFRSYHGGLRRMARPGGDHHDRGVTATM